MTVDDALRAMAVIDGQHNGTETRTATLKALHLKLIEDPENFWETFFDMLDAENPSPARITAERLLREGAVNDGTTIADIPALIAWDKRARPPANEQR